ncbi:hypothetical protein TrVFT333_004855 [Trichoderma virens FT-333]|nr:hypothetical protein TrVFT333_004855 [Trichoderma virens FT-333]
MSAPPPPPPHGEVPKSGLPPGNYDIFVIPQHSSGSGFLYLPSLQPNVNSFVAGFASALICVALFQSVAPAVKLWLNGSGVGGTALTTLLLGVGIGSWALGRMQTGGSAPVPGSGDKGPGSGTSGGFSNGHGPHGANGGHGGFGGPNSGGRADPNAPPPPPPHGRSADGAPPPPRHDRSQGTWKNANAHPEEAPRSSKHEPEPASSPSHRSPSQRDAPPPTPKSPLDTEKQRQRQPPPSEGKPLLR